MDNRNRSQVACDCKIIHEENVAHAQQNMPSTEKLFDAADFFKVFGDSTRIAILWALSSGEMCGCDISALLNMTQSAISHQMRYLKQARLVRSRREGKMVFFRLDDNHILEILKLGIEHISE